MRIRISMTVDRSPIELAPSGDLGGVEQLVLEDPGYLAWILEAPIDDFKIEAVE